MKRKLALTFLVAQVLCVRAETPIQLSSVLSGANALPPNHSPLTATGSFTFFRSESYLGLPLTNVLHCFVHFPDWNFTNQTGIFPNLASIQNATGTVLSNADYAFYLSLVYHPLPLFPYQDGSGTIEILPLQFDYEGLFELSDSQVGDLLAGRWYVTVTAAQGEEPAAAYEIRGRITPLDSDHDGVPDYLDECPNSPVGAIVDASGCSIDQLCPCDAPWRNHGQYMRAIEHVSKQFRKEGLITKEQQQAIVRRAANSSCGKRRR